MMFDSEAKDWPRQDADCLVVRCMMSVMVSPADVLTTIARSLVAMQRYSTVEDALNGLAISEVQRKVTSYQRRIRALERKHDANFETFSARLQGSCSCRGRRHGA